METCAEHGRLCAYRGDEADRCPWCHSTWAHILAEPVTRPGDAPRHSCESARVWSKDKAGREVEAAAMRREAAVRVGRGANRAAVGPRSTAFPLGPQGRPNAGRGF